MATKSTGRICFYFSQKVLLVGLKKNSHHQYIITKNAVSLVSHTVLFFFRNYSIAPHPNVFPRSPPPKKKTHNPPDVQHVPSLGIRVAIKRLWNSRPLMLYQYSFHKMSLSSLWIFLDLGGGLFFWGGWQFSGEKLIENVGRDTRCATLFLVLVVLFGGGVPTFILLRGDVVWLCQLKFITQVGFLQADSCVQVWWRIHFFGLPRGVKDYVVMRIIMGT